MPDRKQLPGFHDQEELETAIDRLGAGMGQKARWGNMSIGKAQMILRDAVAELIVLRGEHSEWVCPRCMAVHQRPPGKSLSVIVCPSCRHTLRPYAQLRIFALECRIAELEEQVKRLEDSLHAFLDLDNKTLNVD